MERSYVKELSSQVGQKVLVKGYVTAIRKHGSLAFLNLRDRSGNVQIVINDRKNLDLIDDLNLSSVISVNGDVVESSATKLGVEIQNPEIFVLTKVNEILPIEVYKDSLNIHLDTDLDYRSISIRQEKYRAIFKVQAVLVAAYREYMTGASATEFFGPAMTSASSEGGAEVFNLPYFESKATLAQSNQLYKQMMIPVFEKVFALQKWFRAENSNTRRHLTEGSQMEFEMGFIDSFSDVMDELENVMRFMLEKVRENCVFELEYLKIDLPITPEGQFPRLKFSEVKEILEKEYGMSTKHWKDMTTEGEKAILDYSREKLGSEFLFITNFDKGVFYAYKDVNGVYQNFDLLCREAEIVSGGQRVHDYETLLSSIKEAGMNSDDLEEYLAIFKYGMPPHGGFGIGLERLTMLVLGLENIREATLFPSDPRRVAGKRV